VTGTAAVPDLARPDFALGIDPGPSTGFMLLNLTAPGKPGDSAEFFQTGARSAPWLLRQLLREHTGSGQAGRCGIEAFAPGRGPGARMGTGKVTRDLVEELAACCAEYGVPVRARNASVVKAWDGPDGKRLEAAGLLALTPGSTHARDAGKHALYTAVWDCGYPDPLSRAGRGLR
jgi:hypothetical protein